MKKSLTHEVIRTVVDITCVYFKDYFKFYNRDQFWRPIYKQFINSETNFGITCSNCSMKLLSDLVVKIGIIEISNINFRVFLILGLICSGSW